MDGKIKLAPLYSEGVEWFLFLSLAKTNHQMLPFLAVSMSTVGLVLCVCVCGGERRVCVSQNSQVNQRYIQCMKSS